MASPPPRTASRSLRGRFKRRRAPPLCNAAVEHRVCPASLLHVHANCWESLLKFGHTAGESQRARERTTDAPAAKPAKRNREAEEPVLLAAICRSRLQRLRARSQVRSLSAEDAALHGGHSGVSSGGRPTWRAQRRPSPPRPSSSPPGTRAAAPRPSTRAESAPAPPRAGAERRAPPADRTRSLRGPWCGAARLAAGHRARPRHARSAAAAPLRWASRQSTPGPPLPRPQRPCAPERTNRRDRQGRTSAAHPSIASASTTTPPSPPRGSSCAPRWRAAPRRARPAQRAIASRSLHGAMGASSPRPLLRPRPERSARGPWRRAPRQRASTATSSWR
mmetsp:Transcript_86444/g.241999  ORF Transcript_86444/g.241999 Transcript_86444/m.241999 type:complete len:335 (+) Transcript_86444:170-1174(+)